MKRSKEVRIGLLTASLTALLAGCDDAPPSAPTMMTEQNRPAYVRQDECFRDFGEQNCERRTVQSGRTVYQPNYHPGQTHFYESGRGRGYYQGSPTAQPNVAPSAPRGMSTTAPSQPSAGTPSGTGRVSAPGGFGGTARTTVGTGGS